MALTKADIELIRGLLDEQSEKFNLKLDEFSSRLEKVTEEFQLLRFEADERLDAVDSRLRRQTYALARPVESSGRSAGREEHRGLTGFACNEPDVGEEVSRHLF